MVYHLMTPPDPPRFRCTVTPCNTLIMLTCYAVHPDAMRINATLLQCYTRRAQYPLYIGEMSVNDHRIIYLAFPLYRESILITVTL